MEKHLVTLEKRDLSKGMGERYEKIIVNCLVFLDEDNKDFTDQSLFRRRRCV